MLSTIPVYDSEEILADCDSRSPSAGKPKPVMEAWLKAALPIEIRPVVPARSSTLATPRHSGPATNKSRT